MRTAALLCPSLPLLAALLLALPAGAQPADKLPNPLRYAVEGSFPPFSEVGTDGKVKGFDIDIGMALCERMKVQCTQVQVEFDAMIPALRAKKVDAILASMSITPEREKAVDFTSKYYNTPSRMVVRADAKFEITPEGLKGKRIGVQRNTIQDRFASATFKGAEIVRYSKGDEVFLDLVNGRVDAALSDVVNATQGFLKTPAGRGFALRGPSYDDPAYFGSGAGIALRKGDKALQAALNAALAAIRADGSYKRIADKYFDFDVYGAEPKKP
jgi:arginine/ornithine transport system substrate-binding protein